MRISAGLLILACAQLPAAANAQTTDIDRLRAEIAAERAELARQRQALEAQQARLEALEARLGGGAAMPAQPSAAQQVAAAPAIPSAPVGAAPEEQPQEVAVLGDQGGIVSRAGRLTLEANVEYQRADRNRVIFRGVELVPSILTGVYNISESRQDILTGALGVRFGVSSRFELTGRLPYVYRTENLSLAPINVNPNVPAQVLDEQPAKDHGIGDIEFGARYQITDGRGGRPYLIASVQAVAPTGTDPFKLARRGDGVATEAPTGAGFWGVTPTLTALLPTDPATLFGSLGYTFNFGRDIGGRQINNDNFIDYVDPGDSISASAGIGLALNQRTSISFAYAHSWAFGTFTRGRSIIDPVEPGAPTREIPFEQTLRDLQLGRFLFGISYRTNARTTINWNVEVGATDDSSDVRTTLRIPFTFDLF